MPRNRCLRPGFTLIELLVVVAIIALLVAIILPSLGRAREMSKRASCGANLRGQGQAFFTYANSYDGVMMPAQRGYYSSSGWSSNQNIIFRSDFSGDWGKLGLQGEYADYVGGGWASKSWICPATASKNIYSYFYWGTNPKPGGTYWAVSNYYYFMGDPGNRRTTSYFRTSNTADTSPANLINNLDVGYGGYSSGGQVWAKLTLLQPGQILAQDMIQVVSGIAQGNHQGTACGWVDDIFSNAIYGGKLTAQSGYYLANSTSALGGANVLYTDGSVQAVPSANLVPVWTNSTGWALQLGLTSQ